MARIRLDKLLVKRKIAETDQAAQELISQGVVLVNGSVQKSAASFVDGGCAIEFVPEKSLYVSRGGLKLEHALEVFHISPQGKRCLDIGASTGGFTDCLLRHGASSVVAVDVGHGQLDLSLRNDERVSVFEKTNAKSLTPELIGGTCELGVADVSFTSIIPLINPVVTCLDPIEIIVLIKPQFECEQRHIDSRGIVTDPAAHRACIAHVRDALAPGLIMKELDVSPIKGGKGNIEYLCLITLPGPGQRNVADSRIEEVVTGAFAR